MARLARVVVPGLPHHVTQRGNGRARTFFGDADYALYRDLLGENCRAAEVEGWAWCLMPNHVHLILAPSDPDGLRRALARTHRSYAGIVQARRKRSGHFWQGRFGAVAMDEEHLAAALRYVSLNPVRARLVERAQDWRWRRSRIASLVSPTCLPASRRRNCSPACAPRRASAGRSGTMAFSLDLSDCRGAPSSRASVGQSHSHLKVVDERYRRTEELSALSP